MKSTKRRESAKPSDVNVEADWRDDGLIDAHFDGGGMGPGLCVGVLLTPEKATELIRKLKKAVREVGRRGKPAGGRRQTSENGYLDLTIDSVDEGTGDEAVSFGYSYEHYVNAAFSFHVDDAEEIAHAILDMASRLRQVPRVGPQGRCSPPPAGMHSFVVEYPFVPETPATEVGCEPGPGTILNGHSNGASLTAFAAEEALS